MQGQKEAAFLVYEDAISIERQKEGSLILSSLLIQYSRFLSLVSALNYSSDRFFSVKCCFGFCCKFSLWRNTEKNK